MADATFKFDKAALTKHLDALQTEAESHAGKRGCNPFIWVRDNITPLRDRLEKESSEALAKEVMAVKAFVAPAVPAR